jgi:hypothetical protein
VAAAIVGGRISDPSKAYTAEEVTINATNFPDKKFRSYVKEEFDTDENGVLSSEEISAVKTINVFGKAFLTYKELNILQS